MYAVQSVVSMLQAVRVVVHGIFIRPSELSIIQRICKRLS